MVDFFGNGLCIHCHLAKNELMDFSCFNDETEKSWRNKDDKLQGEIDKILQSYPEKSHDDVVESYSWDLHLSQCKYPNMHRESLVITLYNFLEDRLNRLCHMFRESVSSDLKLKDLHGQGVERALLYLSKVVRISLEGFGAELPFIKGASMVRNIIVHTGGILPEGKDKVNGFVSRTDHISGNEGCGVKIHSGFIPLFINTLLSFFEKLDIEIQTHIREYNA